MSVGGAGDDSSNWMTHSEQSPPASCLRSALREQLERAATEMPHFLSLLCVFHLKQAVNHRPP